MRPPPAPLSCSHVLIRCQLPWTLCLSCLLPGAQTLHFPTALPSSLSRHPHSLQCLVDSIGVVNIPVTEPSESHGLRWLCLSRTQVFSLQVSYVSVSEPPKWTAHRPVCLLMILLDRLTKLYQLHSQVLWKQALLGGVAGRVREQARWRVSGAVSPSLQAL